MLEQQDLKSGTKVRLVVPENRRLDGASGIISVVAEWGAHILTSAAASGTFRALPEEIILELPYMNGSGYTGDVCDMCGSCKMRRAGTCMVCEECGSTTGC